MTSKRFPGKSLAMLNGKPVIQHVIERAKLIRAPIKIKRPIHVVVAVPDTPESEPLLKFVTGELGVDNACHPGDENDVLARYLATANLFKFDVIMRITGDCPLIDPKVCSEVLQLLLWRKVDYASNIHPERTFPKGMDCEVFTYDLLEYTYIAVKDGFSGIVQDYDKEHVTPFMQRENGIKRALVKSMGKDKSHLNYCVDHPSDIKRLEEILNKKKVKLEIVATTSLVL